MLRPAAPYVTLFIGLVLGAMLSYVGDAGATRNSSGTYSLPAGNPVVSGTTIASATHNSTMSDVATALTDSLDRNGRGAMLAPLLCSNGTVAAPALTFDTDRDTGLYRVGANNPAMSAGNTKVQEWSTAGSTFPLAATFNGATTASNGVTITQAIANGVGLTISGNGTGAAISATGPTGLNTQAIVAIASGNNHAVSFAGAGNGSGILATSGATGEGVIAALGGSSSENTNTRYAFRALSGHLSLEGGNPASSTGFTNTLTPTNIPKAWGRITTNGAGSVTMADGFNMGTPTLSSNNIVVDFTTDMANANYTVLCTAQGSNPDGTCRVLAAGRTAGGFTILGLTSTGSSVDCSGTACDVGFVVFGRQ